MLQRMALGLCASEELRQMLIEAGAPAERLRLYHLGVDLTRFQPGERDPERVEVVMVGRFVEKKGFEYGLRAFAHATRDRDANVRLTLVGSGERESALRAIVNELELGQRVRFAGVLEQTEVAALLSTADVLLAPSVVGADGNRDSGLIVVKEASACHTVPIGTLHGGIPEIIDDEQTGYLVAERDVEAMGERLGRLIDDPALRQRLGTAARAKMEREYDAKQQVAELETRYDEAQR
jgi:colanic acid/amylovoran biosynthesis glycosyltransferase